MSLLTSSHNHLLPPVSLYSPSPCSLTLFSNFSMSPLFLFILTTISAVFCNHTKTLVFLFHWLSHCNRRMTSILFLPMFFSFPLSVFPVFLSNMPDLDFTSCHFYLLVHLLHGIKNISALKMSAGEQARRGRLIILFSERKHEDLAAVFIRERAQNLFSVFSF